MKRLKLAFLILLSSCVLVACNSKKRGNDNNVVPPSSPVNNQAIANSLVGPGGECQGCLQQPGFVLSALGKEKTYNSFELALDFYGEVSGGADPNNAATACGYAGSVIAIGNFHLLNNADSRFCQALPGKYSVHSVKSGGLNQGEGFAQAGTFGSMTLLGRHEQTGQTVTIELSTVIINGTCDIEQVRATGIDGSFRFALQGAQIDSFALSTVNGQPCYSGTGGGFWLE